MAFYDTKRMFDSGVKSNSAPGISDEMNEMLYLVPLKARGQLRQLAMNTMFPPKLIVTLGQYAAELSDSNSSAYTLKYSTSNIHYKAYLKAGIVISDVDHLSTIFNKLQEFGSLKIVDIVSMHYSIFAFNDSESNLTRLSKSVGRFNESGNDFFAITLKLTIDKVTSEFNLLIVDRHTKIYPANKELRISYLKEKIFPSVDNYFHGNKNRKVDEGIFDFIDLCRKAINNG